MIELASKYFVISIPSIESTGPLRILAVADLWQGSDAYAYVRAFRRMGHSVSAVSSGDYIPSGWRRRPLRALRRLLEPVLRLEYNEALLSEAEHLRPHLLFVFKGRHVAPATVQSIRKRGAVAVNFYPDVSFLAHGRQIPRTLPLYDWIFTTKTFGMRDMAALLEVHRSSFVPHSYDPEVHRPVHLSGQDKDRYVCDVSFIGTWSPKKERLLAYLHSRLPEVRMRIWGSQWDKALASLGSCIQGRHVLGVEFAKALVGSKVNIAILSEARLGASSGDLITSRTFHIPATGAFMLHERTEELSEFFTEGVECACFSDTQELVHKVRYYLDRDHERQMIAASGRKRSLASDYSVDSRALRILERVWSMMEGRKKECG